MPDHPERVRLQAQLQHQHFFKAAKDVEKLVVLRLLELTKLQMTGLGK